MRPTITDLFLGRLDPSADCILDTPESNSLAICVEQLYTKLLKTLNEETACIFKEYCQDQATLSSFEKAHCYAEGFALGMRLATECYISDECK